MLNVQEGQICICVKSDRPWWTRGTEYEVVRNKYGELCLVDDDGAKWRIDYLNNRPNYQFKRKEKYSFKNYGKVKFSMDELPDEKEKIFDLNTLTTAQLREYVGLLEDKENTENLLNEFTERMSK